MVPFDSIRPANILTNKDIMMLKKSLIALSLLTLPLTASANWSAGAGYANFSDDGISLDAAYASMSYLFPKQDGKFVVISELRYAAGISDDTVGGLEIKLDNFTAFSMRGQYNYDNGMYLYAAPSLAQLSLNVKNAGSITSWDLGLGAGVGKKLTDQASVEASYENYDGTDVFSVGFKYAF